MLDNTVAWQDNAATARSQRDPIGAETVPPRVVTLPHSRAHHASLFTARLASCSTLVPCLVFGEHYTQTWGIDIHLGLGLK